MPDDLPAALFTLDRVLLHQNLSQDRAASLADEVRALNDPVCELAAEKRDFFDEPSDFLSVLRQYAWSPKL